MKQELGLVGLGKMGAGLAQNLLEQGWTVHGYNRTHAVAQAMTKDGLVAYEDVATLIKALPSPKVVWLMLPAGKVVDEFLFGKDGLVHLLKKNDVIIDGGNSFFEDAKLRARKLKRYGIRFLDVGTSGGPAGARHGACLMIGGEKSTFLELEPLFKALAKDKTAYQFFPGFGAGHFVKMVHNGIEYGMMQAIAEGFAVMQKSSYKLSLTDIAHIYQNGSVIESRLVGWMEQGFHTFSEKLKGVSGSVGYTGEGEWTVKSAKKLHVPVPVIETSFKVRVASQKKPNLVICVLSAMNRASSSSLVADTMT